MASLHSSNPHSSEIPVDSYELPVDDISPHVARLHRQSLPHGASLARDAAPHHGGNDNPFLVSRPTTSSEKRVASTSIQEVTVQESSSLDPHKRAQSPKQPSLSGEDGNERGQETADHDYKNTTDSPPALPPTSLNSRADGKKSSGTLVELNKEMKAMRIELKAWETSFLMEHDRPPTQADIAKEDHMVKKYRAYGKLKKAIAAQSSSSSLSRKTASSSSSLSSSSSKTASSSSAVQENNILRTPKKSQRTSSLFWTNTGSNSNTGSALLRTPTKKAVDQVEYISPNVIGIMSPRRSRHTQDDVYDSPSSSHLSRPTARDSVVSSPARTPTKTGSFTSFSPSSKHNTTPRLLFSPRKPSGLRPPGTPSSRSLEAIEETLEGESDYPIPRTPTRQQRTPTSRMVSSYGSSLTNPFMSPLGRPSAKSPLFGGMNKSKRRAKTTRVASNISDTASSSQVQADKVPPSQPTLDMSQEGEEQDLDAFALSQSPRTSDPLLLTPRRSAASKASRNLFRHSTATDLRNSQRSLTSPSRKPMANRHSDFNPFAPRSLNPPDALFDSAAEALDSMSIHDNADEEALEHDYRFNSSRVGSPVVEPYQQEANEIDDEQWIDEGRAEDPSQYSPEVSSPMARAFLSSNAPEVVPSSPSWRRSSNRSQLANEFGARKEQRDEEVWISTSPSSPRSSDQVPSLTFSEPSQSTPLSPDSDDELLFVAAGFHSHHQHRRRRPFGRSTLPLSFSQLEDEKFAQEYQPLDTNKEDSVDPLAATKEAVMAMTDSFQDEVTYESAGDSDVDGESIWKDSVSGTSSSTRTKKKTQKRSTKLHRIVVSSTKTTTTTVRRTKRSAATKVVDKDELPGVSSNDATGTSEQQQQVISDQSTTTNTVAAIEPLAAPSQQPSTTTGWANSNKPLVKSDRTYGSTGYGRAGARRSASSSSHADGNYVAYNLQRKSGRSGRGGFRGGRSRASTSFYSSGQNATITSRFDTASWRVEYDQDLAVNTGMVTNIGSHQQPMFLGDHIGDLDDLAEPDQEVLPWYGKVPEEEDESNPDGEEDPLVATISPAYLPDDSPPMKVNLGHILRKVWGYSSFREGQLETTKRILNNESTLLVLPTGGGKSLSYQLPAYIFSKLDTPSLTLVISPMISLMYDQVKCLPPGLIGACWTSAEQTDAQFKDFMAKLTDNTIKILFISPEKLTSASFLSLIESNSIPRISLLCVDEVHCSSEWSHNFRPAYLMLNHVLKTNLGSPCVLGLTGTATETTKASICAALDIDRSGGVLSGPVIRKNLTMSVSLEDHREEALLNMLRSPRFMNMDAILIYVMKQSQADHLAAFLRVRNFNAESYHAGKSSQDRQRIQERFMHGNSNVGVAGSTVAGSTGTALGGASKDVLGSSTSAVAGGSSTTGPPSQRGIRILCATIAFGMGLNKSNIRSVIHFCMPKSLENYIQEIGRSGRDGRQAYCHMFLSQEDYLQHRSLAYADGLDFETLQWLLYGLFAWTVPGGGDLGTMNSSALSMQKDTKGLKRRNSYGRMSLDDEEAFSDEHGDDDGETPPSKKVRQNSGRPSSVKSGSSRQVKKYQQESQGTPLPKSIVPVAPPEERLSIDPRENMYRTMLPSQPRRSHHQWKRWVIIKEEQAEQDFDLKKEVLATLLSYLELDHSKAIKCHGSIQSKCMFKVVQSEDRLVDLDQKSPLLDWIIRNGVKGTYRSNSSYNRGGRSKGSGGTLSMGYTCDTMHICQTFDISHSELYQELQKLRRQKWIVFEMSEPGWLVEIVRDPVQIMRDLQRDSSGLDDVDDDTVVVGDSQQHLTEFLEQLSDRLYQKVCAVERAGVAKVDEVYKLFHSVATPTWQMHPALEPRPIYSSAAGSSTNDGGSAEVEREMTEPELVLAEGIQEYFARTHGEGIGDVFEDMKNKDTENSDGHAMELDTIAAERAQKVAMAQRVGKSMAMYTYQPPLIQELQRNWRAGLEVDLRVFLSQQFQQLGDDWLQWQAEVSGSAAAAATTTVAGVAAMGRRTPVASGPTTVAVPPASIRMIESPRVVTRIFHGISSPCFPAMVWARSSGSGGATQYWAKYGHFDFATLMQMANRVLKELKVKYKVQAQTPRRSR